MHRGPMHHRSALVLFTAFAVACAGPANHSSASATDTAAASAEPRDTTLRREFLERAKVDQAVRMTLIHEQQHGQAPDSLDVERMITVDTDRVATARGQPQVYGSQANLIDGHVVLEPIADSAEVDARRARVGLPPLAEYVRLLDSLYTARPDR